MINLQFTLDWPVGCEFKFILQVLPTCLLKLSRHAEPNHAEPLHVVEEQVNKGTRTPVSQVEVVLKVAPLRSGCNCIDHYGKQTSSL